MSPQRFITETDIAPTGHGATHPPQPVHEASDTVGKALPPTASRKTMARLSQRSPHTRHVTPFTERQAPEISARAAQGASPVSGPTATRAPVSHDRAHAPQNVHSPLEKSTTGNPPPPRNTMLSGQTSPQRPQREQRSTKIPSVTAQGGLTASTRTGSHPRTNARRPFLTRSNPASFFNIISTRYKYMIHVFPHRPKIYLLWSHTIIQNPDFTRECFRLSFATTSRDTVSKYFEQKVEQGR